jgi:hypothetical protein
VISVVGYDDELNELGEPNAEAKARYLVRPGTGRRIKISTGKAPRAHSAGTVGELS